MAFALLWINRIELIIPQAPEVLSNEYYGTPADVYSYGIILWELLTKTCPFGENRKPIEIAISIINKNERPIIPSWCNPRFRGLIEKCWNREEDQRLTFDDILRELSEITDVGGGDFTH